MTSIPRLTLNFVKQRATYPREKNQSHSKTDLGLKIKKPPLEEGGLLKFKMILTLYIVKVNVCEFRGS